MYSNGKSLIVTFFILMANHLLLGVKNIPCRVDSLIDIQLKQNDWGLSNYFTLLR